MKNFVSGKIVALLMATNIAQGADTAQPPQAPPWSAEYAKWRDHVLPNPSEQSYQKIPWRASVLHGIVDAQRKDRPVMLVLMNGHPLGCT